MANLKGAKPDKLMRDALMLELHRDDTLSDGEKVKRLRRVAYALVAKAMEGDVAAIKEIHDRIDGKVPQATTIEGGETALKVETTTPLEAARQVAFALALGQQALKQNSED